jgi:hypothetical protein
VHPSIRVRPRRHGRQTSIEVDGWPGGQGNYWLAYTDDCTPQDAIDAGDWACADLQARTERLKKVIGGTSGLAKGRVVTAYDWYRFHPRVAVGEVLLHVESRAPLMITRVNITRGAIANERYAVRAFLIACCLDIADALQERLGIDDGWLDWKVPSGLADDVLRVTPGFRELKRESRPMRGGTYVILRRGS